MTERGGATNEQLAAAVKNGEPGATLLLWEAVRRFVEMVARRYARAFDGRIMVEDLTQSGFIAVLEAVRIYDPSRGTAFLTALTFTLKKEFAKVAGVRSKKVDPLQKAGSIDVAAFRDDPDGLTVADVMPDDSAALAFMGVEYADFMVYCRGVIHAALASLPEMQSNIIRSHILEGRTLEDTAALCGQSCKQAASDKEERGLRRLECGPYARQLRECLGAFDDFRAYSEAAARETWNRSGVSRTEAAALVKSGGMTE